MRRSAQPRALQRNFEFDAGLIGCDTAIDGRQDGIMRTSELGVCPVWPFRPRKFPPLKATRWPPHLFRPAGPGPSDDSFGSVVMSDRLDIVAETERG